MQEIKLTGMEQIERLSKKLDAAPEVFQEARKRAFEAAAPEAKRIVDRHIGGSGKVRSWQEAVVGSKGGYAAVRPKKETWTEASKRSGQRYAVGAVTNAIVSGHRFPRPSGRKDYKARIKISAQRVPGKPFYSQSAGEIEALAKRTANNIAEALMKHMED